MECIVAQQRLKLASKPRTKQMDVFNICPGSKVLVFREKKKQWEGPFILHKYDNYKTAYVEINGTITPFSITVVKKFLPELSEYSKHLNPISPNIGARIEVYWPADKKFYPGTISAYNFVTRKHQVTYDDGDQENLVLFDEKWKLLKETNPISRHLANVMHTMKCFSTSEKPPSTICAVIVDDPMDPRFIESSREEMKGLLERGTYEVVSESDIPNRSVVLRSKVIHSIKTDALGNERCKTRLVILGHTDPDKNRVVNEAPTILRHSVRLILAVHMSTNLLMWSRDVTLAFIQSEDKLDRKLYVKLPKKPPLLPLVNKPNNGLLQVLKPQYGLSESPSYWWQTFKRYHINDLGMTQSVLDPCLFFKKREGELVGLTGTLVDDT
eukprot:IDg23668t1